MENYKTVLKSDSHWAVRNGEGGIDEQGFAHNNNELCWDMMEEAYNFIFSESVGVKSGRAQKNRMRLKRQMGSSERTPSRSSSYDLRGREKMDWEAVGGNVSDRRHTSKTNG